VGKPRITSQGTSFLVLLECLDATHANMLGVLFFSVMLNHVNTTECGYPKKLTPKKKIKLQQKKIKWPDLTFFVIHRFQLLIISARKQFHYKKGATFGVVHYKMSCGASQIMPQFDPI